MLPPNILLAAHPIVHLNASLNAVAMLLLLVGLYWIRHGRVEAHKRTMLAAFVVSTAFLACYVWYHVQILRGQHVAFTHPGAVRYIYYAILASHILLAFTVPFLAVWTIYLGLRSTGCCSAAVHQAEQLAEAAANRQRHMRWARWTFPIWLYVSATGVLVYVMLYHLWPPTER